MFCPSQWMLVRGWIQLTFGFKTEVGSLHKSCTPPCRHKSFINVTWICLPCVSHCTEEMYTKRCHFLRLKGKRQQAWVSIDRNQTVGNRLTNSRYHTNCKWNSSPLSCMSETYMKLIHAIFPEFSVVGGGTSAVPEDELPEYAWMYDTLCQCFARCLWHLALIYFRHFSASSTLSIAILSINAEQTKMWRGSGLQLEIRILYRWSMLGMGERNACSRSQGGACGYFDRCWGTTELSTAKAPEQAGLCLGDQCFTSWM